MIRFIFRLAVTVFLLWIIVSVILGIISGIANMPYEDGPIDGCENLKETVFNVSKDLKKEWEECEPKR